MNTRRSTKGFTLIELLIVIGIVVILSVVVILTLNPAQLLRQARDSTRISDISTLKSAIALYLADVLSPDIDGASISCSVHPSSTISGSCNQRFTGTGTFSTSATPLAINGLGWIPINFASTTGGSPIAAEPVDPVNNSQNFYAYRPDAVNFTYEVNANLESNKYTSGADNLEANDGGSSSTLYEGGTAPGLDL